MIREQDLKILPRNPVVGEVIRPLPHVRVDRRLQSLHYSVGHGTVVTYCNQVAPLPGLKNFC